MHTQQNFYSAFHQEPIVVEISNSEQLVIEDNNADNENYVIKPSVAPATPHVFASAQPPSPSSIEIALKASLRVESDVVEPSISTSVSASSSIVKSFVVVEEKKEKLMSDDENNLKKGESIVVLQKEPDSQKDDDLQRKDIPPQNIHVETVSQQVESSPKVDSLNKEGIVIEQQKNGNILHSKNHKQHTDGDVVVHEALQHHKEKESKQQKEDKEASSSVKTPNSNVPPKENER